MKKNMEWKQYVKDAKKRLNERISTEEDVEPIFVHTHRLTSNEIKKIDDIAKEVAASNEFVVNPIGKMIDLTIFDRLNEVERTKYLFDLSSIYLKLKEKYQK